MKFTSAYIKIALAIISLAMAHIAPPSGWAAASHGRAALLAKAPKKKEPKGDAKKEDAKKKPPQQQSVPKEYVEALKMMERQEWKKAIELLNKAIEKRPTPKDPYYPHLYLGIAYANTGDLDAARKYCEASKAPKEAVNQCLQIITQAAPQANPPAEPSPEAAPVETAPVETAPETPAAEATAAPAEVPQAEPTPTEPPTDAQPAPTDVPAEPAAPQPDAPTEQPTPADAAQPRAVAPGTEAAPEAEAFTPGKTYAVIIGLGDFQDDRIPDLRYTVNDAQGMYDVLIDPNYGGIPQENVTLLLNKDATSENIKRAIGTWLKQQAGADDTIIIYFAGHGAPEGQETYWVTYNADIDDLYATALSNKDISDMLDRVEARRVITLLDSCYSAATVNRTNKTRDVGVEIPWDQFTGKGRLAISASDGAQLSLEMQEFQHGVFTYYMLEGLKGKADGMAGKERDGMVEVEELWNFVRNSVTETAKKQGNRQTPVFQGDMTAGIPLTYDLAYLKELEEKRAQETQKKQAALKALFEQQKISAPHFDCACNMLESGQSNGYLDGLLAGDISPETFGKLFACPE